MKLITLPMPSSSRATLWREVHGCLPDAPPLAALLRDPWSVLLSYNRPSAPANPPAGRVYAFPRAA